MKGLVLGDCKEEAVFKILRTLSTPNTSVSRGCGSWQSLAFHPPVLSLLLRLGEHLSLLRHIPHALDKVAVSLARESHFQGMQPQNGALCLP